MNQVVSVKRAARRASVAVALAVLAMPLASRAEEKVWQQFGSINQFWDTNGNWLPAGRPQSGDDARLVGSPAAGSPATDSSVLYYNNSLSDVPTFNSVTLDQVGGGRIDLIQHESYPHEFRATSLFAGLAGYGGFVQRAGSAKVADVYLGYGNGGSGTFDILNASPTVASVATVERLYLGYAAGSIGLASVWRAYPNNPAPTLNATYIEVGRAGEAWFSQEGGKVNAATVQVNTTAPGANALTDPLGLYGFYGGTLAAGTIDVGTTAFGRFSLSNGSSDYTPGTATVSGDIRLGVLAGGKGVLEIMAGHSLSAAHLNMGLQGLGRATQSGTSTSSFQRVTVGSASALDNSYTLQNSAVMRVAQETVVGRAGRGTLTQTGGTHDLTHNGTAGDLILGQLAGADATYLLRNYTNNLATSLKADDIVVGSSGTGAFRHDGGQATANNVYLGFAAGGRGTWTVEGVGSVTGNNTYATRLTANNLYVGYDGTGTFDQTTTEANFVTVNKLYVAANPGSAGTYTISGGSLGFTGSGRLLRNNGTLRLLGGTVGGLPAVENAGTIEATGASLGAGTLQNSGTITVAGGRLLSAFGDAANGPTGVITNDGGRVSVNGTFTNAGAFVTSNTPGGSSNKFSQFRNLAVDPTGYVQSGDGDVIGIVENLLSNSTRTAAWKTAGVTLVFSDFNAQPNHTLAVTGEDRGPFDAGYADNFAWGRIVVDTGESLTLVDGTAATAGGAVYTRGFSIYNEGVSALSRITGNGLNIYYDPTHPDSGWLGGQTYALGGGGSLAPIPEPAALSLVGGASALLLLARGHRRRR